MNADYIVITHQIVGSLTQWQDVYGWDRQRYATAELAIREGIRDLGHDDFNIGHVEGDRLVWFGWQHEQLHDEDMAAIAAQIGLGTGETR